MQLRGPVGTLIVTRGTGDLPFPKWISMPDCKNESCIQEEWRTEKRGNWLGRQMSFQAAFEMRSQKRCFRVVSQPQFRDWKEERRKWLKGNFTLHPFSPVFNQDLLAFFCSWSIRLTQLFVEFKRSKWTQTGHSNLCLLCLDWMLAGLAAAYFNAKGFHTEVGLMVSLFQRVN